MSENPVAGWYEDPTPGSTSLRYWDGTQWTEQYTDAPSAGFAASSQAAEEAQAQEAQAVTQPYEQQAVQPVEQPAMQQPEYAQQTPEYAQQAPQYGQQAPQYGEQASQYGQQAPQYYQQAVPVNPQIQQYAQQAQQYPPAYSYNQPGAAVAPGNGKAVASLVLGIVSVLFIAWPIGIAGIIFGILGLKSPYKRGMSIAGIILGGFGTFISIVFTIIFFGALAEFM